MKPNNAYSTGKAQRINTEKRYQAKHRVHRLERELKLAKIEPLTDEETSHLWLSVVIVMVGFGAIAWEVVK